MTFRDGKQLIRAAKENGLLPLYLLYGEDTVSLEQTVERLKKMAVGAFPEMNSSVYDGRTGFDMEELINAVLLLPFLAERRCVLLDDYQIDSAQQSDSLFELLEELPEETTLIITMRTGLPDFRKKSSKLAKLMALCEKAGGVCAFARPGRNDAVRRIAEQVSEAGCSIGESAAGIIADYCGLDMLRILQETEKLCAYAQGEITASMVEQLVAPISDARVFDLSDKLVRGNLTAALDTIEQLLFQREEPAAVLAILSMAFVDIYRARTAARAGVSDEQAKKAFGYGSAGFRYTKGKESQRRFSDEALRKILELLARADSRLKSSAVDGRVVLEMAVIEIFQIAGSR